MNPLFDHLVTLGAMRATVRLGCHAHKYNLQNLW